MNSIASLKEKLLDQLVKTDCDLTDSDLITLKKQAFESGVADQEFDQLLQECVNLAQWEKKKKEKKIEPGPEIFVVVFNKKVTSPQQLGQVLFENPADAQAYLVDDISLKSNIGALTNNDVNKIFKSLKIFKSTADPAKRFLKIVYFLNPTLPFRIENDTSTSIQELLSKGFQNYDYYQRVYHEFENGNIRIWLKETNPIIASKLSDETGYPYFLEFVYSISAAYPFYLQKELFLTPVDLTVKIQQENHLKDLIIDPANQQNILIWLNAIEQAGDISGNANIIADNKAITTLKGMLSGNFEPDLNETAESKTPVTENEQIAELSEVVRQGPSINYSPTDFEKELDLKIQSAQKTYVFGGASKAVINFIKRPKSPYFLASVIVAGIALVFFAVIYWTETHQKKQGNIVENNVSEKPVTPDRSGKLKNRNPVLSSEDLYRAGNSLYTQKKYLGAFEAFKSADSIVANEKAECMIGNIYYMGLGVAQNDSLALKWYLVSAKRNNPVAIYSLGLLYANGGKGVKKDVIKAYQYLTWVVENANDEDTKSSAREKLRAINEQ